ncbi:MAG: 4-hydroxy-tetrahydrodipicolinate synthase [Chitinophagales bacterium]|nr:4-hydroxy-tetrahydrodipicolinate synthase [Bacteroidota bacterium]MCB9042258.1 4-hydroxy-tetrahydrodipicolinate synthase [Chitinophagales bacterium]
MTDILRGTGVALITPFTSDRKIDFDALVRLVEYQIENEIDYLVALGTTGETPTLSDADRFAILDCIIGTVRGRVPLVAGFGGNDTQHILDSIDQYGLNGIEAILSVSPYYNKPNQRGIYQHYAAIAEGCKKPIILYNVPGRTSSNIVASTTLQLARDFKNIIGIKEASGSMEQCMNIIKRRPKGFLVISGDDVLTLPYLSLGMDGVISVIANAFPREYDSMVHAALSGDLKTANQHHYKLLNIMQMIYEDGNPAGVKEVLNNLNIINTNTLRLPLANVNNDVATRIKNEVKKLRKDMISTMLCLQD